MTDILKTIMCEEMARWAWRHRDVPEISGSAFLLCREHHKRLTARLDPAQWIPREIVPAEAGRSVVTMTSCQWRFDLERDAVN